MCPVKEFKHTQIMLRTPKAGRNEYFIKLLMINNFS